MGICSSCFKGSTEELITPDAHVRRQAALDAAEKRRQDAESRGIKDPEKFRRAQAQAAEKERRELEMEKSGQNNPSLKWQAD